MGAILNRQVINNLRFANDIVATAEKEDNLQVIIGKIEENSTKIELTLTKQRPN